MRSSLVGAIALFTISAAGACGGDDGDAPIVEADAGGPLGRSEGGASLPPPPRSDAQAPEQPIITDCPIGAAVEREANDTPETATAFDELSFCGLLATPEDVDYSTFTVPSGKKLTVFQAVIDGRVDFDLSANGRTFGPADVDKFTGGKYVVKAYTKAGKTARYRYRIQFD